jgi:chromosome segregation ATPase
MIWSNELYNKIDKIEKKLVVFEKNINYILSRLDTIERKVGSIDNTGSIETTLNECMRIYRDCKNEYDLLAGVNVKMIKSLNKLNKNYKEHSKLIQNLDNHIEDFKEHINNSDKIINI